MRNFITAFFLCFVLKHSFGQVQRKFSIYLQGQYNHTIYDATKGNNPWGMGLGLQLFLRQASKLRPTIDLTADAYLEDDKVMRLYPDGTPMNDLRGMVNIFTGACYHPIKPVYFSFVGGPSFVSGQTLLGLKPSVGFYFLPNQRCTGKVSFINVFNRDKRTNEDFNSISLSLGVKLF